MAQGNRGATPLRLLTAEKIVLSTVCPGMMFRHLFKGGAWYFMDHDCRSANRDRSDPDRGLNTIGFRLVLEPDR